MYRLPVNRRKLWSMKCESLFQIIASSLSPEVLERWCQKHQMSRPAPITGKADWYQWAHEQCHQDSPFARRMQHYLNRKHAAVLARFRVRTPDSIRQMVETIVAQAETALPKDMAGIMWAIASDPRQEFRAWEDMLVNGLHLLSHHLLVTRLRGETHVVAPEKTTAPPQETVLQQEVMRLRSEGQALQTALAHQTQEIKRLQHQLQARTRNHAALQHQLQTVQSLGVDRATPERDIKKLRHQINKLTTLVDEKDQTIQQLHGLVQSYTACLKKPEEVNKAPEPPTAPRPRQTSDLRGKKVALVGGMGRAVPHYLEAIQALGGCCLHHNGNLSQGEKKLAEIVKQADIVFCMVNRNSHSATTSTKKLCKALHKPCYFLPSSGISQVRDKLLELAV
jgi:hypothetical protein